MLARLRHPSARQHVCDEGATKIDPTGTGAIRRRYRAIAAERWNKVSVALRNLVIEQDFFGLAPAKGRDLTLRILVPATHRVPAFQGWLDDVMEALFKPEELRFDRMVTEAYVQAVKRATRLTDKNVVPIGAMHHSVYNVREGASVDMQNIVNVTKAMLVRKVSMMRNDLTPAALYHEMAEVIRIIGINRTNTLISVMVVTAHTLGTLDQFAAAGVTHVGVLPEHLPSNGMTTDARGGTTKGGKTSVYGGPGSRLKKGQQPSARTLRRIRAAQKKVERFERVEILTAGDNDVCPECEDIADNGPYDIDTARSLIPAHPNCRCVYLPLDEQDEEQDEDDE